MKKFLVPILIVAVAGIIIYTLQGTGSLQEIRDKKFIEETLQERRDKDSFMRLDEQSPIKDEEKKSFPGLNYFDPDPDWKIEARVKENEEKELIVLPTSDDKQKPFKKWGYAVFEKEGKEYRLLLLEAAFGVEDEGLFLPFSDATSARETYGAGRYLDPEMPKNKKITLDFNKAYNPYCAYSDEYSCPFPPEENILPLAVTAGEKTFENYD